MHLPKAIARLLLLSAFMTLLAVEARGQGPNCVQDTLAPTCGEFDTSQLPLRLTVRASDANRICEIVPTLTENTLLNPQSVDREFGDARVDESVVASKIDVTRPARFELRVTDCCGNVRTCDPVMTSVLRTNGRPMTDTFLDLPQEEGFVRISNGTPGLRKVTLVVNGQRFQAPGLADGDEVILDVSAAMEPGLQNVISLTGYGKPGGSAAVLIWDGSE